jgi:carboxypeptidase D
VRNLVKVFPSLARRPLHLTGESYAGTYIVSSFGRAYDYHTLIRSQPYIMKGYFSMSKPPTKVVKIAIGNGATTDVSVFEDIPVVRTLTGDVYPLLTYQS